MKTQISRDSHDPEKSYSGVYQQQGRMITDADWNELVDVVKRLIQDAVADIVGRGAPRERGVVGKDAAGEPRLQWGYVYVDGLMGEVKRDPDKPEVFSLLNQRDFPLSASQLPQPSDPVCLYLDLWERVVTALEDPSLADPALNGADTCTRTQVMAQVKWCPESINPEDLIKDPIPFDSTLTLSPIELPEKDYLFRLEVHEKELDTDFEVIRLVLKWSSENAAEAILLEENGALPPQFQQDDYCYERYTDTDEKFLGAHFGYYVSAREFRPFEPSQDGPERYYLRRWDGYCVLNADADGNWSIKEDAGYDRGKEIELVSGDPEAHGDASITGTKIRIRLLDHLLEIDLSDPRVLAGDYWQAVVRKSAGKDGCVTVLNRGKPLGIRHRYLTLGTGIVNKEDGKVGSLALAEDSDRSLTFPALADLAAEYVRKIGDTMSGKLTIGAADNAAESDMLQVNGTTSTKALTVNSGTAPQRNDVLTAVDATGKAEWAPPPQPLVFGWKQVGNDPILQTFLQTSDGPTEAVAVRIGDSTKKWLSFSENKIDAYGQPIADPGKPLIGIPNQTQTPLLINNDPALTAYAQAYVRVGSGAVERKETYVWGFSDASIDSTGALILTATKPLEHQKTLVVMYATAISNGDPVLAYSHLANQATYQLVIYVYDIVNFTLQKHDPLKSFDLRVSVFRNDLLTQLSELEKKPT